MNQIPNIEETNTREGIEEKVNEEVSYIYSLIGSGIHRDDIKFAFKRVLFAQRKGLVSKILNYQKSLRFETFTGRVDFEMGLDQAIALIDQTHHQQLQKAREDERERIKALFPKLNPNSDSWGTTEMERILKAIDN